MCNSFRYNSYLLMALDPVHVGTGGYRLGRVDNTIVREPGTNLPKIPGTSLSGVLRSFMAMRENKYPQCVGQGQSFESENGFGRTMHCGKYDCAVCMSFGFSASKSSFQGLIQVSDAHILFFPVYSRVGPVWITSPGALRTAGVKEEDIDNVADDGLIKVVSDMKNNAGEKLNLGWLLLQTGESSFNMPIKIINNGLSDHIKTRAVLVSDNLFSCIVNDNLEVRTSVSIDPDTGAARDKALFTYEAIPRTTILHFEITISDPELFKVHPGGYVPSFTVEKLKNCLEKAADYMQWLGVGGMNTRGMGRVRLIIPSLGGS